MLQIRRYMQFTMAKKRNLEYKKTILPVPYILKKEKSGYVVECIDLNIVTQGKTVQEAKENIIEAINLHLQSAMELGILDKELDKLGITKKHNKWHTAPVQLNSAPIEIPCPSYLP